MSTIVPNETVQGSLESPLPHQSATDRSADRPVMSLIIAAGRPSLSLKNRIELVKGATQTYSTEILVACDVAWPDPPPGVRVVVTGSMSRGNKFDLASDAANGEVLAFLDEDVQLTNGWQRRAVELLSDATIGAAGGPQLLPPGATVGQHAAWTILRSGSLGYRFSRRKRRAVRELPTSNLVVRRAAFQAVGGFQCPSPLGDDVRLCYKLRLLLGLRVQYDPDLAVEALPPAIPRPFLSLIYAWGRQRGDLARRLPETSRRMPYLLPPIALVASFVLTGLALWDKTAALGLIVFAAIYALAGLTFAFRGHLRSSVVAVIGLPAVHVTYAAGFIRGFFGRSMGEVSPHKSRRKPVRILIFNWRDITHPWAGGAEAYMHELGKRWVRDGCEVTWVSERYRVGSRLEVIDGIRIHRIGGRYTLYPLAAFAYLRLRNRCDVIIDCENGIPFFTPLYSHKPIFLLIFHLHGDVFRRELSPWLRWLALWLEAWLMPRVYRGKQVVTISPSTSADLLAKGYDGRRLAIVVPGVELPNSEPNGSRSETPLVIYVGRLKRYKSVDVLLRAMPTVLTKFPESRLAIIGQGPDRQRLERLAWELGLTASVRFHGYVDNQARNKLLSRSWVAVCPSAFEGWGVSCLEASASGTAVIAARVGGLKDAVIDGVTGVLVPYGDAPHLAQEISRLLADSDRRKVMGEAGRLWAGSHNWDGSAEIFLRKIREGIAEVQPAEISLVGATSEEAGAG